MVKTEINAGICGFIARIETSSEDSQNVKFKISTSCDKIRKLKEAMETVTIDAYQEIGNGFDGEIFKIAKQNLSGCCAGCVVPVGIFKSMQVAANLALPMDISIKIIK